MGGTARGPFVAPGEVLDKTLNCLVSVRLRAEAIATALTDSGMGLRKVITQNGGFPCNPEDLMSAPLRTSVLIGF